MTDTQFMSAKEKEMILKQWKNFLKHLRECSFDVQTGADYGYFPTSLNKPFTKRLYNHLSGSFGFIAHYNRLGFLSARFGGYAEVRETCQQMLTQPTYNADYKDINDALIQALRAQTP